MEVVIWRLMNELAFSPYCTCIDQIVLNWDVPYPECLAIICDSIFPMPLGHFIFIILQIQTKIAMTSELYNLVTEHGRMSHVSAGAFLINLEAASRKKQSL